MEDNNTEEESFTRGSEPRIELSKDPVPVPVLRKAKLLFQFQF